MELFNKTVGFAITGSFCSFNGAFRQLEALKGVGCDIVPIMSETAWATDTRFGKAEEFVEKAEQICGKKVIHTISDAEPIGPKKLLDILIICPCTGNTMAKLANGITDTAVTMAAKAHLRNNRPLLIALATNDGLGASGRNIMTLINSKNVFFVPFGEDDPQKKPKSLVCNFDLVLEATKSALDYTQLQPIVF